MSRRLTLTVEIISWSLIMAVIFSVIGWSLVVSLFKMGALVGAIFGIFFGIYHGIRVSRNNEKSYLRIRALLSFLCISGLSFVIGIILRLIGMDPFTIIGRPDIVLHAILTLSLILGLAVTLSRLNEF